MQLTVANTQNGVIPSMQKSGFLALASRKSGAQTLKPISRVEFRKKHDLTNAEAKRQYAVEMAKFTACAAADFAFHAQSMHVKSVNVSKAGARKYTLGNPSAVVTTRTMTEAEMCAALGVSADDLAALKLAKK